MEFLITTILAGTIAAGVVIVIAGIGELLVEHTGAMNIGLDGMIALGAVTAIIVVNGWIPNVWLGLLAATIVGLLVGLFFAFLTIQMKVGQFYVGLAFNFLGNGLAQLIGRSHKAVPAAATFAPIRIPFLADIPVIGPALFNQNILIYFAYFLLPWVAYYLLFKTRHGLNMRAAGQNPAAADACGTDVNKLRFRYMVLDGVLCGICGAYITLSLTPAWSDNVIAGAGWIAITLVIFSRWNPIYLVGGALIFGGTKSLSYIVQVLDWGISSSFLGMAPYVITIILIAVPFLISRHKEQARVGIGPAALSTDFLREG